MKKKENGPRESKVRSQSPIASPDNSAIRQFGVPNFVPTLVQDT